MTPMMTPHHGVQMAQWAWVLVPDPVQPRQMRQGGGMQRERTTRPSCSKTPVQGFERRAVPLTRSAHIYVGTDHFTTNDVIINYERNSVREPGLATDYDVLRSIFGCTGGVGMPRRCHTRESSSLIHVQTRGDYVWESKLPICAIVPRDPGYHNRVIAPSSSTHPRVFLAS
jgi:hypothetical protein